MSEANPWIAYRRPLANALLRLWCFPYGGGGALPFRQWQAALSPGIEVCPVQLPGRETRFRETPLHDLAELIGLITTAMRPLLDLPHALFGHSLGAILAYETALALRDQGYPEPQHLLVSGRCPPHIPTPVQSYHLSDSAFKQRLQTLQGTPEAVLAEPELLKLMMPLLRADFTLADTYHRTLQAPILSCPLTVLGGRADDEAPPVLLPGWREHTRGPFTLQLFNGNHFFINSQTAALLASIDRCLTQRI